MLWMFTVEMFDWPLRLPLELPVKLGAAVLTGNRLATLAMIVGVVTDEDEPAGAAAVATDVEAFDVVDDPVVDADVEPLPDAALGASAEAPEAEFAAALAVLEEGVAAFADVALEELPPPPPPQPAITTDTASKLASNGLHRFRCADRATETKRFDGWALWASMASSFVVRLGANRPCLVNLWMSEFGRIRRVSSDTDDELAKQIAHHAEQLIFFPILITVKNNSAVTFCIIFGKGSANDLAGMPTHQI